jgi:hypothetical protein
MQGSDQRAWLKVPSGCYAGLEARISGPICAPTDSIHKENRR